MIDVTAALKAIPTFTKFCSVQELHTLAESLRAGSNGFHVALAGSSTGGIPIYHIRFGTGSLKVLVVGFPHCNEPIGGLTVFSLMTLLRDGNPGLVNADVEWHIVPCIDPDGATLNEGWTQQPFSLGSHMRNYYKQVPRDQVECSFPLQHKRLEFNQPTAEAMVLQSLLERIRPDFFFSLHNTNAGGVWYPTSRDLGEECYQQLYELLRSYDMPLRQHPPYSQWCPVYGRGVVDIVTTKKSYDHLERTISRPEEQLDYGANSWEFLAQIKEQAVTFVTEVPYLKHPADSSKKPVPGSLRQLKLRIDAERKFIVTVVLDEWDRLQADLNNTSPFFRQTLNYFVSVRQHLPAGLPSWNMKTHDLLFNPAYNRGMTEDEHLNEYMYWYYLLCVAYGFVRLLRASPQTAAVTQATLRLESFFDNALNDIANNIGVDKFVTVDHRTLARVQLGSGLIAVNALLREGKFARTDSAELRRACGFAQGWA